MQLNTSTANVSIKSAITPTVSITSSSTTICKGSRVTFNASYYGGGTSPTFAWYLNGNPVQNGSSGSFSTTSLPPGTNQVYVKMYSNYSGCVSSSMVTSNTRAVTVNNPQTMTVTIAGTTSMCEQSRASYFATVTSYSGTLSYNWKRNGQSVSTANALHLTSVSNNDVITCLVTTTASCYLPATSNTITVKTTPRTTFTAYVLSNHYVFCPGSAVTFTASPGGATASGYQWKKNGTVVTGETGNTYTTTATSVADLKSVEVRITAAGGTCLANTTATDNANDIPFVLNTTPGLPTVVQPFYIAHNTSTSLTASGLGNNETFRWYTTATGGAPLSSTTTPILTASRTYYVTKYNMQTGCESPSRRPFTITVNRIPVVESGPDKVVVLPVNEVTLNGSATDPDGTIASVLWSKASGPSATIPTGAGADVTITDLSEGTYVFRLKATDNLGFSTYDEVKVTVNYPPNNYNYIETTTVLISGITTTEQLPSLPVTKKNISTTYFDGLGRPMQQINWQSSPEEFDMVQPIVYDEFGRQTKNYLPFTLDEKNGWYKHNEGLIDHTSGNYIGGAANFYAAGSANKIADDLRPYSETIFEASPLNRPEKSYGPGKDWHDKGKFVAHRYLTNIHGNDPENDLDEQVIAWNINASGLPVRTGEVDGYIEAGGYYTSGQLYVNSTIDEEGNEVREYTNKLGQVILKKVQLKDEEPDLNDHKDWAQTYYIYDDFGNLRFVFQPKLVWKIAEHTITHPGPTDLDSLAFQYKYDHRKRMVVKRVPGADSVYMVYDKRDRLVLTQDGNQREKGHWSFTKYDALNRPILTGTYENADKRSDMQTAVNDFYVAADAPNNPDEWYEDWGTGLHGYTNQSFPKLNIAEYLSVTYYDDYTFKTELPEFGPSFNYLADQLEDKVVNNVNNDFPDDENLRVKGQVTGSKVKILDIEEDKWIKTVNYYDEKYRPIQSITENHFGKKDIFSTLYDFPGKVLTTLQVHNSDTETDLKVKEDFEYDHAGRLLKTYHQIGDNGPVLLASNEYNELGELVKKHLHEQSDGAFAQSVDYRYNIRGWLNRINNSDLSADIGDVKEDLFGMELFYNYGFDRPQFNGNISGARWANKVDEVERAYGYTYDAMNRLTGADYIAGGTGNWTEEEDLFEVGNLKYDMNGNILNLHRNGLFRHTAGETPEYGITDQLGYKYKGNQLMAVNDAIDTPEDTKNEVKDKGSKGTLDNPEYDYDENGNMTWDGNKKINIDYNYLNLPRRVDFGDGKYMAYTYDAAGTKLYQTVVDGTNPEKRTDYIAGMVYENDELQFVQHEEGRVIPPGPVPGTQPTTEYEYQYHLKDHLGNVRLTFTTSPEISTDGATMEVDNVEEENAAFINYDKVTRINSTLFDQTGAANSRYSIRLSGAEGEKIGLAKSMAVMTGDTVRAKVYGKYLDPEQPNYDQLVQGIVATLATNAMAPGAGLEGSSSSDGSSVPFGGLLNKPAVESGQPQAYLNYLVFDKNMVLMDQKSGYKAMTTAAREDGTDQPHEELETEIIVTEPGFVYIYLSNDSPVPKEVYFDGFSVEHAHSAIVQSDDYYPFGLRFNSYARENSIFNNYLYNDKELQDDLDLGWMDYGARMYMPDLGRWMSPDPAAVEYMEYSPYNFVLNNPIRNIDPDGNRVWDMTTDKAHQTALARFARTKQGRQFLAQYAKAGDVIGNVKFTKDGKYSHQNVAFYSRNMRKDNGITRSFLRTKQTPDGLPLGDVTASTVKENLGGLDKLAFSVDIKTGLTEDQSLETIGHESFIHVVKTTKDVEQGIADLKNGEFGSSEGLFENFGLFMQGLPGDDSDHKLAVDGKVATMEEFVNALDEVTGGSKFRDMYNSWKEAERKRLKNK